MDLSAAHENIFTAIIRRVPFGWLAKLARCSRQMQRLIRIEMIARIGRRNYDLITQPIAGHAIFRGQTPYYRYHDLANFALTVRDPAALIPIAIFMLQNYGDIIMYVDGVNATDTCRRVTYDDLFDHWVNIGLVGCARLMVDNGIVTANNHDARSDQSKILWCAWEAFLGTIPDPDDYTIIGQLDGPHFNLFIDMIHRFVTHMITCAHRFDVVSVAIWECNNGRYDPWFVNRSVARLRRFEATDRKWKKIREADTSARWVGHVEPFGEIDIDPDKCKFLNVLRINALDPTFSYITPGTPMGMDHVKLFTPIKTHFHKYHSLREDEDVTLNGTNCVCHTKCACICVCESPCVASCSCCRCENGCVCE